MIPMLLGIIGFLIFYTLYATGRIKTSMTAMIFIIILITLGIGALWEIIEYSSDVFLYSNIPGWHHFQGNAQQDALNDTMTDLIDDMLGAIFGALLGLWVISKESYREKRLPELVKEVNNSLFKKS